MARSTSADSIAEYYRTEISSGRLVAGDRLPTRSEIRARWDSSLATVDRAIKQLQREGLVEARGRSGTFVTENVLRPGEDGQIAGLADHVDAGHAAEIALLQDSEEMGIVSTYTEADLRAAPDYVADALHIERGAQVNKRFRYRRTKSDGAPVLMAESWAPAWFVDHIPERLQLTWVPGGLRRAEEVAGQPVTFVFEEVSSALATPEVIAFYGLPDPSAMTIVDHTWLTAGEPLMFGRAWHPSGRAFRYRIPRP